MQLRFVLQLLLLYLFIVLPSLSVAQNLVKLAQAGDVEGLKSALPDGPDPEALIKPIYFAAQNGQEEVVTYLLSVGADPDSTTDFGTALAIAARNNHTGIVTALLISGANPNLRGGTIGEAPLHMAADRGAIESARLLLDHNADVNAVAVTWGWPAIQYAAYKDRTEMVSLLREMGAKPAPVEPLETGELEEADLEQGRLLAIECSGCHALSPDDTGWRQYGGPNLFDVVNRPKASQEDIPYSKAMKAQTGRWTPEELNVFLADPFNTVPGTDMIRGRQPDRAARIAIIAYLTQLNP
ncbi:Cytochrome c-552 [Roseovarius albus]|uniref:Cytochrome c-552 n=1 Tax=Roseovarius albus TaxID=1247867 RepID=A0A1X6Y686_9RHOB|nr:ankyrin repeat domain-containing protein [Roseovarius albus]SLN11488.1 Cytochrome c-552 [Roseovarius albus]